MKKEFLTAIVCMLLIAAIFLPRGVAEETPDQEQTKYSNMKFAIYGDRWAAQSFKPTVSSLTKVEVLLGRGGLPPNDLEVIIRDSLSGDDLTSASVSSSDLSSSLDWIEIDLPDVSVTIDEEYYLILRTSGGSNSHGYIWGYGMNTAYTRGVFLYSPNAGSSWNSYAFYDFCFKTYAGESQPEAVLSFDPPFRDFGDMIEGKTAVTSFVIWNDGEGTLTYTLSENCSWLSLSSYSGTSTGEHDMIAIEIDTTGLHLGLHECLITIESNGGTANYPVTVTIVHKVPVLAFDPLFLDFGIVSANSMYTKCFWIWNSGDGVLHYSFVAECSWLNLSLYNGESTGEHDIITVYVYTIGMSDGVYRYPIEIGSNGGFDVLWVNVTVSSESCIPDGHSLDAADGDPVNAVYVDNEGLVGIGTVNPLSKLHLLDGALILSGSVGGTPTSGSGTRLMWIPGKAAFRAGKTWGDEWDDYHIGEYSLASGYATVASGEGSTAMGRWTVANGDYSTGIGYGSHASGFVSTAMGFRTEARGAYSMAVGNNTIAGGYGSIALGIETIANGIRSTAIGDRTTASGDRSTAMGLVTKASGFASTAMGENTKASTRATAMGSGTIASGGTSTAMGSGTLASGQYSTAMGYETEASELASTAMGYGTEASARFSTAMGLNTASSGHASTAMGDSTIAHGSCSTAMGQRTVANSDYSTAMGRDISVEGLCSVGIGLNYHSSRWKVTDDYVMAIMGGKVGINTTSPREELEVKGTVKATSFTGDGSGLTKINSGKPAIVYTGNGFDSFVGLPSGVDVGTEEIGFIPSETLEGKDYLRIEITGTAYTRSGGGEAYLGGKVELKIETAPGATGSYNESLPATILQHTQQHEGAYDVHYSTETFVFYHSLNNEECLNGVSIRISSISSSSDASAGSFTNIQTIITPL